MNIQNIVEDEMRTIVEIHQKFPQLQSIPIVNDESDPEKGWWKSDDWRGGVEYPIAVARNIYNHQLNYFDKKSNIRYQGNIRVGWI